MKERPILFSAPMVRALLAGTKTVTRRLDERWARAQPGDRIWVKETWAADAAWDIYKPTNIPETATMVYLADNAIVRPRANFARGKTRVSLFMRRWMSRLTMELTSVCVEPLQDITEEDARAEGVEDGANDPRELYAALWDSINPKAPWASNPPVVRLAFVRLWGALARAGSPP